jgi:hypothetical protein
MVAVDLLLNRERIGDMQARLLSIFSLLFVFCSHAQKKVTLEISPTSVEVGETFSITITSTVPGDLSFDDVPDALVSDYNNIHQGSKTGIDVNTGHMKTHYFYSFTGMMTKAGKFTVGPAYITNGSKSYPSNEVTIEIGNKVPMKSGQVTAKQLSDPAFGIIQTNKKTIYEGEPLLVSCKVYAKYDPSHVGVYKSYGVPGTTIKYKIGNSTSGFKHRIEKFKGKDYFAFSYDKSVICPSGIGQYQIDPFTMNLHQGYQNFPIVSGSFIINIIPLPANPPADFIGGVGEFNIERRIDATTVKQGDVLKLTVTVSGIGTLQNIKEPALNLPKGFTVYGDPIITENSTVGIHGTEGAIIYEYNIQAKRAGAINLPAATLSYFDPQSEKYVQMSTSDFMISVSENKNFVVHKDPSKEVKDEELVIHKSKIRGNTNLVEEGSFYGTSVFWGGVSFPVLASLLFLIIARKREKSEDKIIEKRQKSAKDSELKDHVSVAKSLVSVGSDSEYYTQIENALRKAYEIEMNFNEDRRLNKSDIEEFIAAHGDLEQLSHVKNLFSTCEQSKYGFAATENSREEVLNNLKSILKKLNKVKW